MQSLWMVVAGLLFSFMGVCVKLGAESFSFGELVFWRGFISLVTIAVYVFASGRSLATAYWRAHLLRSVSGATALMLFFYSISRTSLATATTLNYTSPLFLALILLFWAGERARPALLLALCVGFLGAAMLLRPTIGEGQAWGGLTGLCSAAFVGVAYYQLRQLGALGEPEWRTVFYFSLVTALGGAALMAVSSEPRPALEARTVLLLAGVGGFGVVAQLALTRAYKEGKTLVTASLAYSTVLFSSLFAAIIWGDAWSWTSWLAMAMIVGSGILATASGMARQGGGVANPAREAS